MKCLKVLRNFNQMEDCLKIGNEFINLYSVDNPILNIGDECFFIFHNDSDYHRPLIGKGIVINDSLFLTYEKLYYVKLTEILEIKSTIDKFLVNKPLTIYNMDLKPKTIRVESNQNFNNKLFKVNGFFIRNSHKKILELSDWYINIIREDLKQKLSDIENLSFN